MADLPEIWPTCVKDRPHCHVQKVSLLQTLVLKLCIKPKMMKYIGKVQIYYCLKKDKQLEILPCRLFDATYT